MPTADIGTPQPPAGGDPSVPLVVDLDNSLVRCDVLWESFVSLLLRSPLRAAWAITALREGKAAFKALVASMTNLDAADLPYRAEVVTLIRDAKARGSKVLLATAADARVAHAVAEHVGEFDGIIASNAELNQSGKRKLASIQSEFGHVFDYVGDAEVDIPIWQAARQAYVVAPSKGLLRRLQDRGISYQAVGDRDNTLAAMVRLIRPRQWVKNLLVLLPIFLAHRYREPDSLVAVAVAFLSMCFAASAIYVLNDLTDLQSDRRHPRKRLRPIARGQVQAKTALALAIGLLAAGLCTAMTGGLGLATAIGGYLVATLAYSASIKRVPLVDVTVLAGFYVYRVLVGAIAADVAISHWLLAFCGFFFLNLALVKRYSELNESVANGQVNSRRGYVAEDLELLRSAGIGSAIASTLLYSLYAAGRTASSLYQEPYWLLLAAPALAMWSLRLWLLAGRRRLHDDPVLFAVRDKYSYVLAGIIGVAYVLASAGVELPFQLVN